MQRGKIITALAVVGAAITLSANQARADVVISTINGYYDVDNYDTPSLHISNTTCASLGTCYDFVNATLKLTGYQGANSGVSQSTGLSNILAGSTQIDVWGNLGSNSGLFAYDYDDSGPYGPCDANYDPSLPANLCGRPGNFYVTFTATLSGAGSLNGQTIFSQFSPDPNLSGAGNAAGVFVGWEGLDPDGYSETTYDSHSNGGPNGVLANIFIGTPPPVATPEPATLVLFGSGLVGLAGQVRRRIRK